MLKISKAFTAVLFGLVVGSAFAASAQTVDELVASGKIRIGVNSAAPPFSVIDTSGKVIGYDVEVGEKIAEFLGVDAEFTPYATAARIPALESSKIDIAIATLTPTPARAKVVMFTIPYVTFGSSIISSKDDKITSLEDLAGKKVGVARGTPQEVKLMEEGPDGMEIARFEDDSIAMQALVAGQVYAIAVPDTTFIEYRKSRPDNPFDFKFSLQNFFMSIAVRKDAYELQQWLNTVISFMKVNGDLNTLYAKWVGKPLPEIMPEF